MLSTFVRNSLSHPTDRKQTDIIRVGLRHVRDDARDSGTGKNVNRNFARKCYLYSSDTDSALQCLNHLRKYSMSLELCEKPEQN